jgi:uncharacterized protein
MTNGEIQGLGDRFMLIRMAALTALLGAGFALLVSPTAAGPSGPSFDCAKAALPAEKAICADAQLSAIDRLIADAYKSFEPAYGGDKKEIARGLVADRNACGADTVCIAAVLDNALETFGGPVPWVESYTEGLIGKRALEVAAGAPKNAEQPMPQKIAQCALTHITSLTTRFGEEALENASPDGGSLVQFANGGAQVSYDREPGLVASRVGDPVAICLMSIPRDCPEGDDRGRDYYGIDLLLKGTWVLSDSQHMCGGA